MDPAVPCDAFLSTWPSIGGMSRLRCIVHVFDPHWQIKMVTVPKGDACAENQDPGKGETQVANAVNDREGEQRRGSDAYLR